MASGHSTPGNRQENTGHHPGCRNTGNTSVSQAADPIIENIQLVLEVCRGTGSETTVATGENPQLNNNLLGCTFSLDTLLKVFDGELTIDILASIFKPGNKGISALFNGSKSQKQISHYLLLPWHDSGVSDVVLNKVRPVIKQLRPTIGFSIEEAAKAAR